MKISDRKESPILGLTGMGGGLTSYILYGTSGSSTYEISRSLRFDSTDSAAYLSGDLSSVTFTSYTKGTVACWIKRSALGYGVLAAGWDGGVSYSGSIQFNNTDNTLQVGIGGAADYLFKTNATFRDVSAWYHIVVHWDRDASADADKVKVWVNGVAQTTSSTTYENWTSGDAQIFRNNNGNRIGRGDGDRYNNYFNGYLADYHYVDGEALDETSFGEFDTYGIWNPKQYNGTHGNAGFHLKFDDNSSASALGTDSSSNTNNWTTTNISVASGADNDSLIDSPSNYSADSGNNGGNYCTWNPLNKNSNSTLSNGNLLASSSDVRTVLGTIGFPDSGKYYAEFTVNGTASGYPVIGILANNDSAIAANQNPDTGVSYFQGGNVALNGNTNVATLTALSTSDIVGVAYDAATRKVWFSLNGTFLNNGDPAAGTNEITTLTENRSGYSWGCAPYSTATVTLNAGQRSFSYTPPTDYVSLCTQNLPTPSIEKPSEHVGVVTYTGNGVSKSVSDFGFSPDFIWLKSRDSAFNSYMVDTVRGKTKGLQSQTDVGEVTDATGVTSFDSSGFTLGSKTQVNTDGDDMVAWAWDAGANSNKTYTVTVADPGSGNKFYVDGSLTPTLTLAEGATYIFDQSDSSNASPSSHPLRCSTASDGTHAGGTEYTTGVTVVGTPGSAGAYTQIVIASPAPTLYAYCSSHSGMGFQVNTEDTAGYTIPVGAHNDVYYDTSKSWASLVTTTSLSSSYNSYSATSKLGCFDGKRSTSLYGDAAQDLVVTFDSTAFPSANGPYTVEVENNQRAVTLNDGLADAQTGSPWPNQATGWQKFNPVSTISTITCATVSNAYGGMINRIRVNGKVLVDPSATPDDTPSISTRILASSQSGFSISKWQGAGANATVAHGCGATPLVYFVKSLDNTENWEVLSPLLGTNAMDVGYLNATDAFTNDYSETPTDLIIGRRNVDADGENMIAYCFAPVAGYSAFGKYTSNNLADGPFIYTGFQPKIVAWKNMSAAHGWYIYDDERNSYNPMSKYLSWHHPAIAEGDPGGVMDILSNGFKVRNQGSDMNASSHVILYMAWAEHPFKNARARQSI